MTASFSAPPSYRLIEMGNEILSGNGASCGPGSREPSPTVSAASGFDPSREIVQLDEGDVELKDCPFCGSPAFWQEACATYWAACTICLANGQARDTLEEAVGAWNTRATVAAHI